MIWPSEVELLDVTPRDGLQDASGELTTEEKVELINELARAGLRRIEVTSFVSPRLMPRMRDAEQVAEQLQGVPGLIALVPNTVGFERAAKCGIREVTYVVSASSMHQMANLRMSLEDSLHNLRAIMKLAGKFNIRVRAAISCAFGSPFEGEEVRPSEVAVLAGLLRTAGVEEVGLADTVGIAVPQVISEVISAVQDETHDLPLALHLHDRFQIGEANVLTALLCGVTTIEAALGGLGGCPFAPNAPGNLDLENIALFLEKIGIHTGVDLPALAGARQTLLEKLNNSMR